jgi:hypothetical protein
MFSSRAQQKKFPFRKSLDEKNNPEELPLVLLFFMLCFLFGRSFRKKLILYNDSVWAEGGGKLSRTGTHDVDLLLCQPF